MAVGSNSFQLPYSSSLIGFVLVPLVVITYLFSNRYQNRLNKVPGPWLRSLSTIPRMWSIYSSHSHEHDLELHKKYGKIVRLAPTILSISDTSEINQIYGISTKFIKSDFYSLSEVYEDGVLLPDPFVLKDKQMHTRMKRNAANAYSLNALVQMEPYVDEVTDQLNQLLDGYATSGQVCDIGVIMKNYAMDAVTSITFGKNFNYLEKGDVLGLYHVLETFTSYMAIFGQVAWTHKYLLKNPRLAAWYSGGAGDNSGGLIILAQSEIEKGRLKDAEDGPMTFTQRVVLNQKANPKSITDHELLTHAWGNLSAGSDTTGTLLRAAIYYILKDPKITEMFCGAVRGNLSLPVKFSDANNIPYITATIYEAMRMHPSVGMILARTAPKEGAILSGHFIAGGTEVGINPYVLHYDAEVFPDPYNFNPSRWLESETDEEHLKRMHRSFLAFGHGAHTCSGRHISMLESVKACSSLFLRYDLELVNGGEDYKFKNRWFTPQSGLLVKLKRRE